MHKLTQTSKVSIKNELHNQHQHSNLRVLAERISPINIICKLTALSLVSSCFS